MTTRTFLAMTHDESFPISLRSRCPKIQNIRCWSHNFESFRGCLDGVKSISIVSESSSEGLKLRSVEEPLDGTWSTNIMMLRNLDCLSTCKGLETLELTFALLLSDLFPLSFCTRLKNLSNGYSSVINLAPLSSMPLLEKLSLIKK